jgi:eukaryotic-like serine/threonine-protein kinase
MALEGLLLDHYRLLQLIGSGGMGEVYLAEDTHIPRQVAVKVVRSEPSPYPNSESVQESERLFKREAKAIALLDHPNILPLYDYGEANAQGLIFTYLVMPYRPEGSLPNWLRKRGQGALIPWRDVVYIGEQASGALQHAHDHQIIHQDVKPSNFLIRERQDNEGRPDLLLADFGIAKFASATSSVSHTSRGTPTYMAPEQWAGNPQPASDQYGLAIMVYELLTGRPPFRGGSEQMMYQHFHVPPTPPSQLNPALPSDVDEVLLRALAKNPAERFSSMLAFARALQVALLDPAANVPTVVSPDGGNMAPPPYPTPSSTPLPTSMPTPIPPPPPSYTPPTPNPTPASLPVYQQASAMPPTVPVSYPQAAVTQAQAPKGRSSIAIISLLVILVLLVGLVGGYVITNSSRSNGVPTPGAPSSNGSTVVPGQTTTPATGSTTTPVAQPTTAQSTNPYTSSGTLLLNDSLTTNSSANWQTGTNSNNASCTFTSNGYDVTQPKQGYFHSCTAYNTNFSNFAFEVQATMISGDYLGIIFCKEAANSYYIFIVHADGSYILQRNVDTDLSDAVTLANGQASLSGTNILAAVDQGGTISIYLNHTLLKTVSDSSYTTGQIGVLAGNDTNSAEVVFTNARVWHL